MLIEIHYAHYTESGCKLWLLAVHYTSAMLCSKKNYKEPKGSKLWDPACPALSLIYERNKVVWSPIDKNKSPEAPGDP